jgi:hypothetical protein
VLHKKVQNQNVSAEEEGVVVRHLSTLALTGEISDFAADFSFERGRHTPKRVTGVDDEQEKKYAVKAQFKRLNGVAKGVY